MVPLAGVEPARPQRRLILSQVRLPIPPQRHVNTEQNYIFNILFVLGSSALIMPIPCASNFLSDAYVAVAATILLLIFGYTQRKIVRWEGLLLLACYVAYAYVALV